MSALPNSDATRRNRDPILEQLSDLLPDQGTVLELGSGTGQHAVYFTRHLSNLYWQPTDKYEKLPGLEARLTAEGNDRILASLKLDVLNDPWPKEIYQAAFSANTSHIMPWAAVQAMFAGVAKCLEFGARFCLYGPFNINGCFTSPGNAQFDAHLRIEDPEMGLRDIAHIESLSISHQMQLTKKIGMPANNFILVFAKE